VVFIVPYRNRPQHKSFFLVYFQHLMRQMPHLANEYELYFSHQCDPRSFNRGATKNIGFLAVKHKYHDDYQHITFVFNDVDTVPHAPLFDYETQPGTVKHFYGFTYALGGIVAINGGDFERINGFPNFWGWGMEDNVLQTRCEAHRLSIDRSQFFHIGSPQVLHLFDGVHRVINPKDPWRATHDNRIDGLKTIHHLKYGLSPTSTNPQDNEGASAALLQHERHWFINIATFQTGVAFEKDVYKKYDLRAPPRKIIHHDKVRPLTPSEAKVTEDWSNIPFYPTTQQKQEMVQQFGQQQTD